jgi:hypothetical protein
VIADCGDYVCVTNARKVIVTGRKADQIVYRHHTMYPGGLKEVKYKTMMERKPDEVRTILNVDAANHLTLRSRSYVKLCLECCQKIDFEIGGWKDFAYLKVLKIHCRLA